MTDFTIRTAVADDVDALSRLGRRTFIETFVETLAIPYPDKDLLPFLDRSFSAEAVGAWLSNPGGRVWAAVRGDRVVGYAGAGPCRLPHPQARPGHAELHRLYVGRESQGLGIGAALLDTALDWMEANTDGPLWLGVWSGNLRAQRLYQAHGFSIVGAFKYPVGEWMDDEFAMRRPQGFQPAPPQPGPDSPRGSA